MSVARYSLCKSLAQDLNGIPTDDEGPIFNAPWEAKVFAMTVDLHERGVFTWPEWGTALSTEIKEAESQGRTDTADAYYTHWMSALEKILQAKSVFNNDTLAQRQEDWIAAAERTPHGQPIELKTNTLEN